MSLNTSKRDAIEYRRSQVAKKRLLGWTQRQLADHFDVSAATINSDLKALDKRWREAADIDVAEHRGRQLGAIHELKKILWLQIYGEKAQLVYLQALKLEAQITGTIAAPSFTFNVNVLMPIVRAIEASGLPPEQAGEAFEAWFRQYAAQQQQQETPNG